MKNLLRSMGAITGLAGVLLVSACSSSSTASSTSSSTASTPVRGGTLTIAFDADPGCYDFQRSQGSTLVPIIRNVFDSLVYENTKGQFVPWLAQSWTISPNGLHYIFNLRHDVTFSNGQPLNAEAVKLSFDRLTSKTEASTSYAGTFPYAGSTVISQYRVEISLSRPLAAFLQLVSSPGAAILSPASSAMSESTLCQGGSNLIGSGPFVVKSYVKNEYITLVRNPKYDWPPQGIGHTGPAYLSQVTFRFLSEESTRVGALESGQADYAYDIDPTDYNALPNGQYIRLHAYNAGSPDLWMLNTTKAPFNDLKVREALMRGINFQSLVQGLFQDTYTRAWSVLTPVTPYYDASLANTWPYDPTLANKLLDEAGWSQRNSAGYRVKDGQVLSANWVINGDEASFANASEDLPLASALQSEAKILGFDINLDVVNAGTFTTDTYDNDYNIVAQGTNRAEADILGADLFSSSDLPQDHLYNFSRVQNPQLDAWLQDAGETTSSSVRRQLYDKVQQWVIANAIAIPIEVRDWLGATTNQVHDVTMDIVGFPEFLYDTWVAQP